jgi:Uma2 family endonuclease
LPEYGGQTRVEDNIIAGAPELVIEIAGSSRAIDRGDKLADYEQAGTKEYVVAALDPVEVYWFIRRGDRFEHRQPDPDGLYRSEVFPGLWLDPRALLADNLTGLLATLERGRASPEHADFVAQLAVARRPIVED